MPRYVCLLLLTFILGCRGNTPAALGAGSQQGSPGDPPRILKILPVGDIGLPGQQLEMLAQIDGEATGWTWSFDGAIPATSSEPRPRIALQAVGGFHGALRVRNGNGESEAFAFQFRVTQSLHPPVIYALDPPHGEAMSGATLQFSAMATYAPDAWTWDFGSGATPATSTEAAPTVTLAAPGTYVGSVIARNAAGVSTPLLFNYTVAPAGNINGPMITKVELFGGSGHSEQWGTYRAISTQSLSSYTWDFGGGATPRTATYSLAPVTFGAPGGYRARVIGHTANGIDTPPYEFTINCGAYQPVIHAITTDPLISAYGQPVTLHVDATGAPTEYVWQFPQNGVTGSMLIHDYLGDHATTTLPELTITPTISGPIGCYVTAKSEIGTSFRKLVLITALTPPVGGPAAQLGLRGIAGAQVRWTATVEGQPTETLWDFGEGSIPSSSMETRPFTTLQGAPGPHIGTFTASNMLGVIGPVPFEYWIGAHGWASVEADPRNMTVLQSWLQEDRIHVICKFSGQVWYGEALTQHPASSTDWTWHNTGIELPTSGKLEAGTWQGYPVVFAERHATAPSTGWALIAWRAATAHPTSSADWLPQLVLDNVQSSALHDIYLTATTAYALLVPDPSAGSRLLMSTDPQLGTWQSGAIQPQGGGHNRLVADDAHLLIYREFVQATDLVECYVAQTGMPMQPDDWQRHTVHERPRGAHGAYPQGAWYQGRPLLLLNSNDLQATLLWATSDAPTSGADWIDCPLPRIVGREQLWDSDCIAVRGADLVLGPVSLTVSGTYESASLFDGLLIGHGDLLSADDWSPECPDVNYPNKLAAPLFFSDGSIGTLGTKGAPAHLEYHHLTDWQ